MGGKKINRIERSFSNVRKDILNIKKRVNVAQDKLKDVNIKLSDSTSKEEFYNFIRELNEEFRKLEKHIATQDGLDRLRQTLKTQINELESEIQARKVINKKLQGLEDLKGETEEIQIRLKALDKTERIIEKVEKSYVTERQLKSTLKSVHAKENEKRVKELESSIDSRIKATKDDFSKIKKELTSKIKEQEKIKATVADQNLRIKTLERKLNKVEGVKIIKGKKGAIEKGLDSASSLFGRMFPIFVLIAIAALLVIGIVFFREDIFSPELYLDPESIECQNQFDCKEFTDGTVLTDCAYDLILEGCHCVSKPIELTDCEPIS